ncbi:MAG: sigma-70 family RNA polymerase sigma factor [Sporichthyaceae bacterium]
MTDLDARSLRYQEQVLPEVEVLLRVARSLTRHSADAEDLVQDTLLRAWRSLDSFDGRHPRAWLLTILRNAHLSRHRRQRPVLLDDPDLTFEQQASAGPAYASAEDVVVDRMFDAAVELAVRDLPPRFREALLLVDVHGLTGAAAAAVLGVPEGTVVSRLHRARRRVRHSLAGSGLAPRRNR